MIFHKYMYNVHVYKQLILHYVHVIEMCIHFQHTSLDKIYERNGLLKSIKNYNLQTSIPH